MNQPQPANLKNWLANYKIIDTTNMPRRWNTNNHQKKYLICKKCKTINIVFESDTVSKCCHSIPIMIDIP